MSWDKKTFLTEKVKEARIAALDCINSFGSGHVGGSMSIIETLVVLYYDVMRIDPGNPKWEDRDRLVLSKGHAAPALYGILAMKGFIDRSILRTINQNGTSLPSHCDMKKVPGIDMTAGSLGQGISAAVGMAIGGKLDKKDFHVYSIIGDGESQEGQVWEAVSLAPQYNLDNLTVFVDNNHIQVDDYMKCINQMEPYDTKFEAFGWDVHVVDDGHDPMAILGAINNSQKKAGKPHAVILNTVKGKYVPGFEGTPAAHYMNFDDNLFMTVKESLGGK
ncbi:MAG: transketolase [Acetivibrionales bacterium]